MAALPYIQLYVSDYLADTAHLSTEEHGAYLLLIMNYWQRGKALPNDNERLARIVRLSNERWANVSKTLQEFFNVTETEWQHERIQNDLAAVHSKSTKASNAGKASAEAKKAKKETKRQQEDNASSTDVKQTLERNINHTDTDTEADIKPFMSSADDHMTELQNKKLSFPFEKFVEVYHTHFPAGARLKVLDDKRRGNAKARWLQASKLQVKPFGYTTEAEGLQAWADFFDVCSTSDFLTGKVNQRDRTPFFADFDWFMKPSSFAKCLENKYHRDAA